MLKIKFWRGTVIFGIVIFFGEKSDVFFKMLVGKNISLNFEDLGLGFVLFSIYWSIY